MSRSCHVPYRWSRRILDSVTVISRWCRTVELIQRVTVTTVCRMVLQYPRLSLKRGRGFCQTQMTKTSTTSVQSCERCSIFENFRITGYFSLLAARSEISNCFLYLDSFIRRPSTARCRPHSSSYFASEIVCLRVLISPKKKSRVIDNSYLLFFEHKILINK
jgi:hypothetical protein